MLRSIAFNCLALKQMERSDGSGSILPSLRSATAGQFSSLSKQSSMSDASRLPDSLRMADDRLTCSCPESFLPKYILILFPSFWQYHLPASTTVKRPSGFWDASRASLNIRSTQFSSPLSRDFRHRVNSSLPAIGRTASFFLPKPSTEASATILKSAFSSMRLSCDTVKRQLFPSAESSQASEPPSSHQSHFRASRSFSSSRPQLLRSTPLTLKNSGLPFSMSRRSSSREKSLRATVKSK